MAVEQLADEGLGDTGGELGRGASILCVVDALSLAKGAVTRAIELAVERGAPMTLLAVATRPLLLAPDPMISWQVDCHTEDCARVRLAEAVAGVPAEVDVRRLLRRGRPHVALAAELRRGRYATIVLARGPRRRGSVLSARLLRMADAEVIVVPRSAA